MAGLEPAFPEFGPGVLSPLNYILIRNILCGITSCRGENQEGPPLIARRPQVLNGRLF
jgi:hypothetical protein